MIGCLPVFQEDVRAGIDEEGQARFLGGGSRGADPLRLFRHRIQPLSADLLILEIHPDSTGRDHPRDVPAHTARARRIGALEIDAERQIAGGRDPLHDHLQHVERQRLAVAIALRARDRPASRRQRLRPGIGHRPGAARIPDIEKNDRIALTMQIRECLRLVRLRHVFVLPLALHRPVQARSVSVCARSRRHTR